MKAIRQHWRVSPGSLAIAVAVALIALGLLVVVLKWAPELLAQGGLSGKEKAEEIGRVRTALLATLAGLVAITGAVFTALSYRLSRTGQITERMTRAVDQLAHSELDVRLGGVYALERIARDSAPDHPQVVEILTAYVRQHAPSPPNRAPAAVADQHSETLIALIEAIRALERAAGRDCESAHASLTVSAASHAGEPREPPQTVPADVQAVLDVLGRRNLRQDKPGVRLDFASTDLCGVVLQPDAHFERAIFRNANLERADLSGAHLEGADLRDAHLTEKAKLCAAYLQGALLGGAHLEGADLRDAHLESARLLWAHLDDATLINAHLERADLTAARLSGARLSGAHLHNADLSKAHLEEANLRLAHLEGASLNGAQLQRSDLLKARMQGASLKAARFEDAILREAHFKGAILQITHFERADLRGADFTDTDLRGGYFDDAMISPDSALAVGLGLPAR